MAAPPPELVVLSLEAAERCEPLGEEVCISITDPGAAPARLSPRFAAVLRLHFNDVMEAGAPTDVLFAAEHARAITEFLGRWPRAGRVVVHCQAGASRSPGVALGLCDLRGWPTGALEGAHPAWNRRVRDVLAGRQAAARSREA